MSFRKLTKGSVFIDPQIECRVIVLYRYANAVKVYCYDWNFNAHGNVDEFYKKVDMYSSDKFKRDRCEILCL